MEENQKTPQLEDGYIKIANTIIDKLCRYRISGEEWQVLLVILRKTYGWNKKQDYISITQFEQATGLKRANVYRAIKKLLSKKIIGIIKNDNSQVNLYYFNKKFYEWRTIIKKDNTPKTIIKSDNRVLSKMITEVLSKVITTKDIYKDNITKDNNNIVSKDTIDDARQEGVVLPDEKEYGNHYVNLVIHYYKKYKGEKPIDKKPRYHAYNISRKILSWIEKNKEYADFLYERVKNNYRPPVSLFEHFLIKMFIVLREKDFFEKIKRLETFYHHMKPIFEQYTANVVKAYEEYKILEERKKLQEREEKIKKLKQEYYLAKGKIRELEEGLSQNTSKIPDYMIKETKKTIEEQKQKMLEVKKQLEIYGQTIA